ncbi:hypothetical protein ACWCPT_29575 [Streptomyces sp. NPDC002308]
MTEQAPPDDEVHVCKPGATTYYCPTAGEVESDCHGGFDVCCAHPELHQQLSGIEPVYCEGYQQTDTSAPDADRTRRHLVPVARLNAPGQPNVIHLSVYQWLPEFPGWGTRAAICGASVQPGPLLKATVTCPGCLGYRSRYERMLAPGYRPEDDDPDVLRAELVAARDERDRARRWAVHLENENRRLTDKVREANEQARVATVAALNLQRQTPDAAQRTLGRIRAARTWVAVWVELGQYFGLTAEQAGLEARSRRVGEGL